MKIKLVHKFEDLISIDNLLSAWQEFIKGKRNRRDVLVFSYSLMDNIFELHFDLANHTYKHGGYQQFKVSDPKSRIIHKASVRDRLLHRAVYRILYPFFDETFIADSFSCRNNKGTHKAINRFRKFAQKVSKNNTKQCWILKCDIKKFFASIDQNILVGILEKYIKDNNILNLLKEIIFSFKPCGLPLGNLTSQLFANIYLNKFDQFIKHKVKARYYIRYADDFVIFSQNKSELKIKVITIKNFLENKLKLNLHQDKIYIKTLASGVDFLGWVSFFNYRIIRIKTKKRMWRRLLQNKKTETITSYLGLLSRGNSGKVKAKIQGFIFGGVCDRI